MIYDLCFKSYVTGLVQVLMRIGNIKVYVLCIWCGVCVKEGNFFDTWSIKILCLSSYLCVCVFFFYLHNSKSRNEGICWSSLW